MPVTRRAYAGAALQTTLSGDITNVATSISIVAATGWPTGAPFYVVIDPGQASEEKVLVTRSSTTLTVVSSGRGVDGTSAAAHTSGAVIYPCITALDLDEANDLASTMTTRGDLIFQGATEPERLAKGTTGYPVVAGASDPQYAQLGTVGIADSAVTTAKIADSNVTTVKIADVNVTTGKLADDAVTAAKINADVAGNGLAQAGSGALDVTVDDSTIEINADTLRVKDAGITAAKLAASVAGDGLTQAVGGALQINADASTVEVATDVLRVKDAGIVAAKIATDAVIEAKIQNAAVTALKLGGPRGAVRTRGTSLSLANASETDITFPTSSVAWTGITYSAPNFTPSTGYGGWYSITVQVELSASTGSSGLLIIYVGANQYRVSLEGGLVHQNASHTVSAIVGAGTDVKAAVYQNSGGSINCTDARFHMVYLGPSS